MMLERGGIVVLFAGGVLLAACDSGGTQAAAGPGDAGADGITAGDGGGDATARTDAPADTGAATDGGAETSVPRDGGTPSLAGLSVSTGVLRPAFDPTVTDYDVTSLNSLYPISVIATTGDPSSTLTIHGASAQSGVASHFTLQPKQDISVVVTAPGGGSVQYTVHYVPMDLPTYQVTSMPGAGTEDILLSPGSAYVLIIDRSGAPLYYRTFLPNNVENFQQQVLPSGAVYYSVTVGPLNPGGWVLGADHLMDQHFNDVADYQLPAYAQHAILPAEGHDTLFVGDSHYIGMSYVQRTVDLSQQNPAWSSQALVMSCLVQEVDHGSVLMEWDSANVPSLYADSVYGNTYAAGALSDYLHLNSIGIDPSDGNLLISLRHASSILKVDRKTAQILWTLGGKEDQFGLTPDQLFSFQHHVRIHPDGTMTVFDNGNNLHQSRVLQLTLDQVNHKVTTFDVLYTKPADEPATGLMGSVTPMGGGRYVIGWGGWLSGGLAPAATEIVNGAPVWSLEFMTTNIWSYRALPIAAP